MKNDETPTDEELLSSFRQTQDQKYLGELYSRYMYRVYGSCLNYLKNVEDAEDAVIDIYEKISRKLLDTKVLNFKSWLYIVTRNFCFEKLRKKKSRSDKENSAHDMYFEEIFHPDNIEEPEELSLLELCMQKLDKKQSNCINLFYFENFTYKEISNVLSITYSQVRSRIQNGRRNLKLCMASHKGK